MTDQATKEEWLASMREQPRPIIFPLIAWLSAVGFAIVLAVLMAGCATVSPSPRSEVCFLRLLGATEDGLSVVASACMTPEEFKESQK